MQSCLQKNEKKHEKWDCGSQGSLGDSICSLSMIIEDRCCDDGNMDNRTPTG